MIGVTPDAYIAHLVEHVFGKDEVEGSSPSVGSMNLNDQVSVLKADIDELIKQVRCPDCHKLLAVQHGDKLIIRCGRCGNDHVIPLTKIG